MFRAYIFFLPCVLLLLSAAFLLGCQQSKRDETSLQQWNDLVKQSLPTGSSRKDVEKFLDQHSVEHAYIATSHFPEEKNTIVAFVRSNGGSPVVRKAGEQLKFRFDIDQRLISFECREMFTGP